MHFTTLLLLASAALAQDLSPKRGLAYAGNHKHTDDDRIWTQSAAGLTWYYNFWYTPSTSLGPSSSLQYVPMLWGKPDKDYKERDFYNTVRDLKRRGNVTHVLGFNEPDEPGKTGGSSMSVKDAVDVWKKEMEPVKDLGVKIGAPACTGSGRGLDWLDDFFKQCDGCNVDFLPVHWYGPFEAFAAYIGNVRQRFPNRTLWVTEFGFIKQDLNNTQMMFNQTIAFLNNATDVERYAYYGAFRSSDSNVGPAAAMLDQDGKLTDIGSWYLGSRATGNVPKGAAGQIHPSATGMALVSVCCLAWLLL